MRRCLVILALVLAVAVGAGLRPADARAADECNGLQVCLPVAGPWVVVPGRVGDSTSTAVWELRCPLPNYVVAGIDARVTDRALDVSIRGENGAPVSPGVTTGRSVLFVAVFTGASRAPTSFQPYVGCIPTQGGGGRAQTSVRRPAAFKPGQPLERRVVNGRLRVGAERRVVSRCPAGSRLVGAQHAVGLRLAAEPTTALMRVTRVTRATTGNVVSAVGRVSESAPRGLRVELQVHAICTRVTR